MRVYVEGRRALEVAWGTYRLDVGVTSPDGVVTGAIEVLHTHAIGSGKALALTEGGLAWCEARAIDILAAATRVVCTQAAESRCEACVAKEKERIQRLVDAAHLQKSTLALRCGLDQMGIDLTPHERHVICSRQELRLSDFTYGTLLALVGEDAPDIRTTINMRVAQLKRLCKGNPHEWAEMRVNADVARVLEENGYTMDNLPENPVAFGKYQGMSLDQIWEIDKQYIRYLAMWTGALGECGKNPMELRHNFPNHKSEARALLEGVCLRCFESTTHDWQKFCGSCFRYLKSEADE